MTKGSRFWSTKPTELQPVKLASIVDKKQTQYLWIHTVVVFSNRILHCLKDKTSCRNVSGKTAMFISKSYAPMKWKSLNQHTHKKTNLQKMSKTCCGSSCKLGAVINSVQCAFDMFN